MRLKRGELVNARGSVWWFVKWENTGRRQALLAQFQKRESRWILHHFDPHIITRLNERVLYSDPRRPLPR